MVHRRYPSQREKPGDRATRRADRIRDKMAWPVGIVEGSGWGKAKSKHWRTYERLCREHDALSYRALVGIMDHLNRLSGRFQSDKVSTLSDGRALMM